MDGQYRKPRDLFDELVLSEIQLYKRHELGQTLFAVGALTLLTGISCDLFLRSHDMPELSPYVSLIPAGVTSFILCGESILFSVLYPSVTRKGMLRVVSRIQRSCLLILLGTIVLLMICAELMIDLSKFVSLRLGGSIWLSTLAVYISHERVIWRIVNAIRRRVSSSA